MSSQDKDKEVLKLIGSQRKEMMQAFDKSFCQPDEQVKVVEVWTRQPNGKINHERFFDGYKPEFYFKRQEDSEVIGMSSQDDKKYQGKFFEGYRPQFYFRSFTKEEAEALQRVHEKRSVIEQVVYPEVIPMLAQVITVTNEKELYNALLNGKSVYLTPGIYKLGKYIMDMKRNMRLSHRKSRSQLKRTR